MRRAPRWNPPPTNPQAEQTEFLAPGLTAPESKGWIGERYDADAGLQYLNARYYDPVLGMFLQPDWFEVLQPGVGTNRFSYSFNDPVNKLDPIGNQAIVGNQSRCGICDVLRAIFGGGTGNTSPARVESTMKTVGAGVGRELGRISLNSAEVAFGPVPVLGGIAAVANGAGIKTTIALELLGPIGDGLRLVKSGARAVVEGIGLLKSPAQTAGAIRNVNPLGSINNCVNCAIATERTLAGFPTSAMPQSGRAAPLSVITEAFGGAFRTVSGRAGITQIMEAAGPGSRGIVFGARAGNEPGHVFNVVNQNGTVRYLDRQSGTAAVFEDDYVAYGLLRIK
jgi:RHS repeat-associated protein